MTLRKFTNGREDFWKVSALYEQTLAGALSRIQELKFVGCSWDDEDVRKFAEVFVFMKQVVDPTDPHPHKAVPRVAHRSFV